MKTRDPKPETRDPRPTPPWNVIYAAVVIYTVLLIVGLYVLTIWWDYTT